MEVINVTTLQNKPIQSSELYTAYHCFFYLNSDAQLIILWPSKINTLWWQDMICHVPQCLHSLQNYTDAFAIQQIHQRPACLNDICVTCHSSLHRNLCHTDHSDTVFTIICETHDIQCIVSIHQHQLYGIIICQNYSSIKNIGQQHQ